MLPSVMVNVGSFSSKYHIMEGRETIWGRCGQRIKDGRSHKDYIDAFFDEPLRKLAWIQNCVSIKNHHSGPVQQCPVNIKGRNVKGRIIHLRDTVALFQAQSIGIQDHARDCLVGNHAPFGIT